MNLAFIILCHRVTPALKYMVQRLSGKAGCFVLIHVDLKSDVRDFQQFSSDNVVLLSERESVSWGGFSQVKSLLRCLAWINENSVRYDYLSVISGDDVLVQPIFALKQFLIQNKGTEFIGVSKANGVFENPSLRIEFVYPEYFFKKNPSLLDRLRQRIFRFGRVLGFHKNSCCSKLPRLFKGSSWFTITRSAVQFILEELDNDASLIMAFEKSFCADEVFFQTILVNSRFRENIFKISDPLIDDNVASLRYIDWTSGPEFPKALTLRDIRAASRFGEIFFARKVDADVTVEQLQSLNIDNQPPSNGNSLF